MDWDKLRIFKAVAEAGSFTHAGVILNLSQSAISRQISSLEESLSLTLFHRHARGLVLTEQGEILYQTTNDVFYRLQQVQTQLTDSRLLPEGPLAITTVEFIASTWLAPQIKTFISNYPDIQLILLLDDRVYDLGRREADIALRLQKGDNTDLIERHLTSLQFELCASKDYLANKGIPEKPEDLKDHMMIGHPPNTKTPFQKPNWILSTLGIEIENNKNVMLINSLNARYTAVQNGSGISVLPKYLIQSDQNLVTLFPELEIPPVDIYFVYPQERRNSKRIAVFRDFLFKMINDHQKK